MQARLPSVPGESRRVPNQSNTGDGLLDLEDPEKELSQLSGLLTDLQRSNRQKTCTIVFVDKRQIVKDRCNYRFSMGSL